MDGEFQRRLRRRKYVYDQHGKPTYVIDEWGDHYFIAPDGFWVPNCLAKKEPPPPESKSEDGGTDH